MQQDEPKVTPPPVQLGFDDPQVAQWKCSMCGRKNDFDVSVCQCGATGLALLQMPTPLFENQGEPEAKGYTERSTRAKGGCPACSAKHLSQAIVLGETGVLSINEGLDTEVWLCRALILDHESRNGYLGHRWLAIGCLANAEVCGTKLQATAIREVRLRYAKGPEAGRLETLLLPVMRDHFSFSGSRIDRLLWKSCTFWAHIEEAIAEIPAGDFTLRDSLDSLRDMPRGKWVTEATRILESVIETYCLEARG